MTIIIEQIFTPNELNDHNYTTKTNEMHNFPKFIFNFLIKFKLKINPLNAQLNPICHLLALLEAHHILYVSRIRVKY